MRSYSGRPDALSRGVLRLHRWCGLTVGLLFIMVAATGASMVFRPQIETLLSADVLQVPSCPAPLPLDTLVAAGRQASPHAGALRAIRVVGDARASVKLRFEDDRWIFIDPCSARVLGSQAVYGGLFGTLARLHIFGYLPGSDAVPTTVAGSVALLLGGLMALGGIWLWRPASLRQWKHSWRMAPGLRGAAWHVQLHRTTGMYAAPVLLVCALTGLPQAFDWTVRAIDIATASAPHAAAVPAATAAPAAGTARASIEAMWQHALRLSPPLQKAQLRFPQKPGQPVVFELVARDAPHANANSYLYFAPASGALLKHLPYSANPLGHRIYLWALAIHYGWVGGVAGQLALFLGALCVPLLAWAGVSSYLLRRRPAPGAPVRMQLQVERINDETALIRSFELCAPDGKPLPAFSPGAHIDVYLPGGVVRQYSLCGDPSERSRYRIAVLRCEDSRGGSLAMHALRPGGMIGVGTPRNHFPLDPGAGHSVLIAGGIGITPILCMARQLAAQGASFELHYCCRAEHHAAFRAELSSPAFAGRVHWHFGHDRLDLNSLMATSAGGSHVYVCGPQRLMDAVSATASALGWHPARVHREYFKADAADTSNDQPFDLHIASTGQTIHVGAGITALAALAAAGIAIPSSCGQGVCGTCVTGILEGEPEPRDHCLPPSCTDRFTPCCSRARGAALVLDL
jgi:vanillate O-demethylase ferredoxin subunit